MAENNFSDIDIKRYIAIVLKRKYIALSVALAVLSIFTWGSFLLPKTFEASSTVFIEKSSIIDPLIRGIGVSSSLEERVRNIRNSMMSRDMITRVIKKLDLDTKLKNSYQQEALVENIRSNLTLNVRGSGGTDLFTLSFKGKDPKVVRDVVNTLVGEYIEESLGRSRTDAYGAYDFFEKQLLEYKNRLEESDRAIREFREKYPRMVPQNESTILSRLEGFQSSSIETEIRLKELSMKRNNLQKQLSGEKQLTVAFVTRDGSPMARLQSMKNQLMLLLTKYTDKYPEVVKTKREIEELKKQIDLAKDSHPDEAGSETSAINPIYQQLKEELARTDAEIESLRARLAELQRQQQDAQVILGRMPKEQEEWSKLQRNRSVYQRIYDDLLQKHESARVSKDLEITDKTGSFKVVDPAILPLLPAKPNRVMMILAGLILGIASGIGAALGLEFMKNSFRDEGSIEAILKVPVFATVPNIVTAEDRLSVRKLDRKILAAAGAYLIVIALVLTREFLHRYLGIRIINF